MELGKRIAEIRRENDLTQEDLAEICSVTRQTISNWENSKSYPDLETLVLISDTYGVSLDVLLKGDKKMVSEITKEQKQGRSKFFKIAIAIAVVLMIVFAGLCYDETHDRYIPYEKSGIKISDDGNVVSTDRNFVTYMAYGHAAEIDNEERHVILFIYLTGNFHTNYINKHRVDAPIKGMSYGDKIQHRDSESDLQQTIIVTEVYYLSGKYVDDYAALAQLNYIPGDASWPEASKVVEQIKGDSVLLWKRK